MRCLVENIKNYLVHRELTKHDVEKRGRKDRYFITKWYARASFSSAKLRVWSGRYLASSTARELLHWPPYLKTASKRKTFRRKSAAATRCSRSFWTETIDSPRVLQNVQILAALRLAVTCPDLVEQIAHFEAGAGPTATIFLRRVVLRAGTQRRLAAVFPRSFPEHLSSPLGILQLQANLREEADQQFIDVVINSDGRLDEFAIVRRRHRFTLYNNKNRLNSRWYRAP